MVLRRSLKKDGASFFPDYEPTRRRCIEEISCAIKSENWQKAYDTIGSIQKLVPAEFFERKKECSYAGTLRLKSRRATVYLRMDLVRLNFCEDLLIGLKKSLYELLAEENDGGI